jgi:thiosulfate/3-mercaptopyruvate sulfurtransferase
MYTTLIQPAELKALQQDGARVRVFDVSFDLTRPEQGNASYLDTHLAGALHADINLVLSAKDPREALNGGRHPLPRRERFAQWLSSQGVDDQTQVVVYDRNAMNYCGRLWWMLKWCGHEAVAVLDGGLQAWVAEGGAVHSGAEPAPAPGSFSLRAPAARLVHTAEVAAQLNDANAQTLIDARATPRYRGETEPLDPVAGHIPGALNRPYGHNLGDNGKFKPAAVLRAEFEQLLGQRPLASVVHHCGSGVSAVPNILAMEIAGLGRTGLYAGSWSEWCTTPGLPCAKA